MTRFVAGTTSAIAVLAFALSYSNLAALASRAGYGPEMAHVWPLVVDGLAVVATAAVMRLETRRTYAWSLLAASTVVSIVAGAAAHLLPAGPLPGWAGAAVAVVPPLCLLVAPHLAVQLHRDADAASTEVADRDDAGDASQPSDATDTPGAAPVDDQQRRTDAHLNAQFDLPATDIPQIDVPHNEKRRRALHLLATTNMSNRAVAREVGTSEASVRRWVAADAAPALATVSATG
ncbi:DUF2637 domain-containing protein [Rhodococcus sp. NPDC003348]